MLCKRCGVCLYTRTTYCDTCQRDVEKSDFSKHQTVFVDGLTEREIYLITEFIKCFKNGRIENPHDL